MDNRPQTLGELSKQDWIGVFRRTVQQFRKDDLVDWAAALTYYGVLSIFPGVLVMVSALRVFGRRTAHDVVHNIAGLAPGPVSSTLGGAAASLQNGSQGAAVVLAVVSLFGALWSASGYVGAFMRASNAIYDVPEGRPMWKRLPIRFGMTLLTGSLLTAAALIVVFTGRLAGTVGEVFGVGAGAVRVWNVAKWPVLVVIVALLLAILYWASPNAKLGGFRWVSPGGLVAVIIWLAASGGFALYVTHFSSYNRVYGSLAAVVIFLVWLWISNIAVLLGAEFDAEIQRGRAIDAGLPVDREPYVPLREEPKAEAVEPDLPSH